MRRSSLPTARNMKIANTTTSATFSATPPTPDAAATAVPSGIRNQAVTSSMDAHASATAPQGPAPRRARPERPLDHPPLDQDAGQHRERGDRHRYAHEEGEPQERL